MGFSTTASTTEPGSAELHGDCSDLFASAYSAPNRFADLKITNPAKSRQFQIHRIGHPLPRIRLPGSSTAICNLASARFVPCAAHLLQSVVGASLIETWNQVYQTISIRSAEEHPEFLMEHRCRDYVASAITGPSSAQQETPSELPVTLFWHPITVLYLISLLHNHYPMEIRARTRHIN